MILLIDNYDSFSFNLYQMIGSLGQEILVVRNDQITIETIRHLQPTHIVLSPGPGHPAEAGICVQAVSSFVGQIPILGVCLGHQAICHAFGAVVSQAKTLMHGKISWIDLRQNCPLFSHLPDRIVAGRYHSLAVEAQTLPEFLEATAWTDEGEVMAVMHRDHPVYGLQFHPESILTPDGKSIVEQFLSLERSTT